MVRKRSGGAYHPRMAERFCEAAPTILAGLDQEPTWESVLALEPGGRDCLTDEEFDRSCEAMADFADIKSPYTLGHSPGVAALAIHVDDNESASSVLLGAGFKLLSQTEISR